MNRLKHCIAPALCAALLSVGANAEERTLRVYNWFDYITPKALEDFKAQNSQTKLVYDIFDTNEALEAKLLTGNSGYDVVVPSNVFLAKQIEAGVFQPLDRSKLPNWNHLDPKLMKLIEANDPGNKFAVPYMYGTILIGFNPAKVKAALGDNAPVDSWDLIFKEENISKLKQCGVALLDSPSEILPLALQHLSLDPNSKKPADYAKAEALLMKIRPYITYFHSSKYMADIANGDICVAVGYSGSFSQAANRAKEAKNGVVVDMRLPKEGAPISVRHARRSQGREESARRLHLHQLPAATGGDRPGQRFRRLPEPEQGRYRAGRSGDPQQPQPVPDRCGDERSSTPCNRCRVMPNGRAHGPGPRSSPAPDLHFGSVTGLR